MSESEEELDEFEQQFRLERLEKERRSRCSNIEHGATRTDPDGTVYEWDADKLAYFPKIDQDFIAQYQMNYGTDPVVEEKEEKITTDPAKPTGDGAMDWSTYFSYVMKYSTEHGKYPPEMTKEHIEYYNYLYHYYYGDTTATEAKKEGKDETKTGNVKEAGAVKEGESVSKEKEDTVEGTDGDTEKDEGEKAQCEKDGSEKGQGESGVKEETAEEKAYREYYEYYQHYYDKLPVGEAGVSVNSEQQEFDEWAYYNYYYGGEEGDEEKGEDEGKEEEEYDEEEDEEESKKKKRKVAKKPDGWFEIEATKNTNVYVSGLPDDITDDEFKELMNKCGMITLDPRGRDYKLKLYRDKDGKPKGDGLCCYMKSESVDLALQMLDDYDVRGHRISVEVAQFEMKGKFDPKKRKKLSNKERKNIKKQQEKLLDWRPSKPLGYRPKHERIIIVKNAFNYKDFEEDPKKIQVLREELRAQCLNFGTVKKVIVYDRHQEGVVSVAFDEVPEADLAIESLNGRFFNRRQITAEAWDGKAKFEVKETEAEREARLKQWEAFLETGDEEGEKQSKKDAKKAWGWKAKKGKNEKVMRGASKQTVTPECESGLDVIPGGSLSTSKRTGKTVDTVPPGGEGEKQSDHKESPAAGLGPSTATTDSDPDSAESVSSSRVSSTAQEGENGLVKEGSDVVEPMDSGSPTPDTTTADGEATTET